MRRTAYLLIFLSAGVSGFAVPYPSLDPYRAPPGQDWGRGSSASVPVSDPLSELRFLDGLDTGRVPDPLDRGRALERRGKIEEARAIYLEVIKANRNNLTARRYLIESYTATGKLSDSARAISQLAQALMARPDYADGWRLSGTLASRILMAQSEGRPARGHASELLRHFARNFLHVRRVVDESRSRLFTKLCDLVEDSTDNPDIRVVLTEVAEALYAKARELAPDDFTILSRSAGFYWDISEAFGEDPRYVQAALDIALKAVEAAPQNYKALALAAKAYFKGAAAIPADSEMPELREKRESYFKSSHDLYERALQLNPLSADLIGSLAVAYASSGEIDAGIECLQRMHENSGDKKAKLSIMQAIAQLYQASGQPNRAEAQWRKILETYPDYLDAYFQLARLYLTAAYDENLEASRMRALERVYETRPRNESEQVRWMKTLKLLDACPRQTELRAVAELDHRTISLFKAVGLLADAVEKHPGFVSAHLALGEICMRARLYSEAEEHFLAAIRLHGPGVYQIVAPDEQQDPEIARLNTFHLALMGLSQIYSYRKHYLKAGDIIDVHKTVYFRTSPRGTLIFDSDKHLIPREDTTTVGEAMLAAGTAYRNALSRRKAIELLEEAIRVRNGTYPAAEKLLAYTYVDLISPKAGHEERRQVIADSRKVWEHLRGYRPDDPEVQFNLARSMFRTTVLNPLQIESIKEGKAYETDAAEAIIILSDMLKRAPNNVPALLQRATIYEFLRSPESALEDAAAVLAMKPQDALVLEGDALRRIPESEFEWYRGRARSITAWLHADSILDLDKAEELARQVLQYDPDAADALDTLAWVQYRRALDETDEQEKKQLLTSASDNVRRALKRYRAASRLYHFAEILVEREDSPESRKVAIECLNEALEKEPAFWEADLAARLRDRLKSQQ